MSETRHPVPDPHDPARSKADRCDSARSGADRRHHARTGADRHDQDQRGRERLAARQAELVAALVSGAAVPTGFDTRLVGAARAALLNKRAGDVARHWPLLATGLGADWLPTFRAWAAARPTNGSLRDGWDLARELTAEGRLPSPAAQELAVREAGWRYDGRSAPRLRRRPALGRAGGAVVVQVAGRFRLLRGGPG